MDNINFKDKADSLAKKMNKLSEKFQLADDMEVQGDDIIEFVEEKTQDIELYTDDVSATDLVNLHTMVDDFKYIRTVLKETTENGRRVLNSVTLDLLDSDDEKRAALIMSFAELNTAIGNNMKLYMQSYKDISSTLLNIDKIKKQAQTNGKNQVSTVNNTLNVIENVNTTELIKQLRENKEIK